MGNSMVSFILITYNQEKFVADALDGAFNQTYSPMEIIVSDDCSQDKTYEIIKKKVDEYKGSHKIVLNQNVHNLGIAGNYDKAVSLSTGDIIVSAAGDDVSLPNRVERTVEILNNNPEATCVSFNSIICDSNLNPKFKKTNCTRLEKMVSSYSLYDYFDFDDFIIFSGDSRAVRKTVFDTFGPLKYSNDEDSSMFVRCLLLGTVCHSHELMVMRRMHGNNVSDFRNIRRHDEEQFLKQPFTDIDFAKEKGLISDLESKRLKSKLHRVSNILREQLFKYKCPIRYKFFCKWPSSFVSHLKNFAIK